MKIENQAETKEAVEAVPGSTSAEGAVKEKRRRAWEQWSPDDIAAFFEGLNEFGKDFDAIQNCLHIKSKKKNLINSTNIKNKDQVRHFYYRTWHKISKYLPTPDEGKRMHKELYGLINYGEMWKRLGGFFNDQLYRDKLNELVQHGVTSVKIKGKSHRIKTPVCPALKRLQSPGTEPQKSPSLPDRIVLELTPCCNADFLRVQSVAHNPRIRICSESSSPLSNIIQFLTKKWKPRSILMAESLSEEELIVRIAPDTRERESSNPSAGGQGNKKRKRSPSGQEQMDEPESKAEARSWILETADHLNVGEIYTLCGGTDGRLALTYSWERRSKNLNSQESSPEQNEYINRRTGIQDPPSLLRALVSVAKSCLMKTSILAADFQKKNRRPQGMISSTSVVPSHLNLAVTVEESANSRSPQSEASPSHGAPLMESPVQFSRMRQRLRRPLRYGSLKRGALALTLNKMPGPAPKSSRTALLAQPSTVSLTWNAADENTAAAVASTSAAPYVVQLRLDGQIPLDSHTPPPSITEVKMQEAPVSPDRESSSSFLRPPSILLHTPVKSGSQQGWATCSTGPSLPSTPQRLQEWMSILLPNTPEKGGGGGTTAAAAGGSGGVESSSVRSISFSIPDSLSTYLGDNFTLPTASSHPSSSIGEGSTWPTRDGDEISLSSLLNQLVSPAKSTASSRYTDLKLPFDLQSLVADNSVDLTAKFAELAASIAAADAASTSKNRP